MEHFNVPGSSLFIRDDVTLEKCSYITRSTIPDMCKYSLKMLSPSWDVLEEVSCLFLTVV